MVVFVLLNPSTYTMIICHNDFRDRERLIKCVIDCKNGLSSFVLYWDLHHTGIAQNSFHWNCFRHWHDFWVSVVVA